MQHVRYNYGVRMNCDKCAVELAREPGPTSVAFVVSSYLATGVAAEPVRICRQCVEGMTDVSFHLTRPVNNSNFTFVSLMEAQPS